MSEFKSELTLAFEELAERMREAREKRPPRTTHQKRLIDLHTLLHLAVSEETHIMMWKEDLIEIKNTIAEGYKTGLWTKEDITEAYEIADHKVGEFIETNQPIKWEIDK